MKLREAEMLLTQDQGIQQVCRAPWISAQTYYRWRREYGGMDTLQAKKLKELDEDALTECIIVWPANMAATATGPGDRPLAQRGLAGQSQASGAHLAPRRPQSTPQTAQTRASGSMTDLFVRLLPEFPKHVWNYDFMQDPTQNRVPFRILNVIDEYTRECLAVRVKRRVTN